MSIHNVTGAQLVEAMLANNWQVVGEREGLYKRLALMDEGQPRHTLTVPLNPKYSDYDDLLGAAIGSLEVLWIDGQEAHRVLHRLDPALYQ